MEILDGDKSLTGFAKTGSHMFDKVLNTPLAWLFSLIVGLKLAMWEINFETYAPIQDVIFAELWP